MPTDDTEYAGDHPAAAKMDPDFICLCPGIMASRLSLAGSKDALNSARGNINVVGNKKWNTNVN